MEAAGVQHCTGIMIGCGVRERHSDVLGLGQGDGVWVQGPWLVGRVQSRF